MEAYKNEVDLVKLEVKSDMDAKDRQIKVLQQTVQSMHHVSIFLIFVAPDKKLAQFYLNFLFFFQELTMSRDKLETEEELVKQLEEKVKAAESSGSLEVELVEEKVAKEEENGVTTSSGSSGLILDKDAKLVGMLTQKKKKFVHFFPTQKVS